MQILVILDPLESIKTYKDTSYTMMVAAQNAGHEVSVCEIGSLSFDSTGGSGASGGSGSAGGQLAVSEASAASAVSVGSDVTANCRQISIRDGQDKWYEAQPLADRSLTSFDAVIMRTDPPFNMEYVYATYMLELAESLGAAVFNRPGAIRDHNEKFSIGQFPHLTAPTIVTRDPARLRAFVQEHGRAIFKLLDGMGGMSIFQATREDPNLSVIIETLNQFGRQSVMAQKFLPQISAGDKRILLIGGEVVPHALARVPAKGEVRGNMAAGGTPIAQPLSDKDRAIAEELAPQLSERGLFLVGLDVIGDCVTEINVTSPTGFREIVDQTGFDVAAMFINKLEQAVGH